MRIVYSLERDNSVKIHIYNAIGERVASIQDNGVSGGHNFIELELTDFAPGIYYYILEEQRAGRSRHRPVKFVIE